jgi:hypothetical protein
MSGAEDTDVFVLTAHVRMSGASLLYDGVGNTYRSFDLEAARAGRRSVSTDT